MRIGILSAGGDCPGINAAIRGACKTAINCYGMEVVGIKGGFEGLINRDIDILTDDSMSGLLSMGGTVLGTSRFKPYKKNPVTGANSADELACRRLSTMISGARKRLSALTQLLALLPMRLTVSIQLPVRTIVPWLSR